MLTISNFIGKDPLDEANRYNRKNRQVVQVPRPASIATYNKFMGGVDKCDMLLSLYRTLTGVGKGIIVSLCISSLWLLSMHSSFTDK